MKSNREYRNEVEIVEVNDYIVEGYATTWNTYLLGEKNGIDYYERISKDAFLNADFSDVIMQYDHAGRVFARTSNDTLQIETDDKGLKIRADLSKSKGARELYEEIASGLITKMSWGFTIADENYDRETRTREILEVKKVYDVSAVSIPANQDTCINARSFIEGVIDAERQELLERKRAKLLLELEIGVLNEN